MKIQRTYKEKSAKAGQVVIVDEAVAREVFGQTSVAHHEENVCKQEGYKGSPCYYCAVPAMNRLYAGAEVETYFSKFQLVAQ